jgi:hypothetical protein
MLNPDLSLSLRISDAVTHHHVLYRKEQQLVSTQQIGI